MIVIAESHTDGLKFTFICTATDHAGDAFLHFLFQGFVFRPIRGLEGQLASGFCQVVVN